MAEIIVTDARSGTSPRLRVANAPVYIGDRPAGATDEDGKLICDLKRGDRIRVEAFGQVKEHTCKTPPERPVYLPLHIGASIKPVFGIKQVMEGDDVHLHAVCGPEAGPNYHYQWHLPGKGLRSSDMEGRPAVIWVTTGAPGDQTAAVTIRDPESGAVVTPRWRLTVNPRVVESSAELSAVTVYDIDRQAPGKEREDTPVTEYAQPESNEKVEESKRQAAAARPPSGGTTPSSALTGGPTPSSPPPSGATPSPGSTGGATPPPPLPSGRRARSAPLPVTLDRTRVDFTRDKILWTTIRNRTNAIRFGSSGKDGKPGSGYVGFIDSVLCKGGTIPGQNDKALIRQRDELYQPIHGVGAFELLKTATQVFLLLECGAVIKETYASGAQLFDSTEESMRFGAELSFDEARKELKLYLGDTRLPYIDRVLDAAFASRTDVFDKTAKSDRIFCEGYLGGRANCPPMLELIWSYWHEEAMLVQTMKALADRFQNRRSKGNRDPLANLEIAPLYPLNNLLWGYIQDEVHLLSVARRNYEYSHHYGLGLYGQAISDFRPADPRSRFLEGFHNLLYRTTLFYKQDDDNTYNADGFPVLNALREVHLLLSEGAHNQFGDLPWTARAEMLMEQWLLARPEMRLFLQSRDMVPYREKWMPQVDAMKQLQGWTDVSVTHFNFLAVHGEQLLLSIRYGDWIDITDPDNAANWARDWRPEIQNYIHAYRAVTGVDLAADASESRQAQLLVTRPSELLRQRLEEGRATPRPVLMSAPAAPQRFRERRAARAATDGRQ